MDTNLVTVDDISLGPYFYSKSLKKVLQRTFEAVGVDLPSNSKQQFKLCKQN